MRSFKFLIALISAAFFQNAFAFVTFFNRSATDTLVINYAVCSDHKYKDYDQYQYISCSSTGKTQPIQPMTAYYDKDIVTPEPTNPYPNSGEYPTISITSVEVTSPDHTVFIKHFPSWGDGDSRYTTCNVQVYPQTPDPAFMLDTFDAQSDVFCTPHY